MNLISPYDLETGHTYYIESYTKGSYNYNNKGSYNEEIGRASCRERV